jgi:hypothetical protein
VKNGYKQENVNKKLYLCREDLEYGKQNKTKRHG